MIRTLVQPHTGRHFKLGRKPSKSYNHLALADYLDLAKLPDPPQVVHYSRQAERGLAMILANDKLGCCTSSAAGHITDAWRGNAGSSAPVVSEADAIAFYSKTCGYIPGNEATDQGGDLLTVMQKWQAAGYFADGSSKILGWAAVDATSVQQVKTALWLFENLYVGVALPDAWISPMPAKTGFMWNVAGAPDINNGHAVAANGYNDNGLQIDTWGMEGVVSWAAVQKYLATSAQGEMYAILSQESLNLASQKAASGFDLAQLQADLTLV